MLNESLTATQYACNSPHCLLSHRKLHSMHSMLLCDLGKVWEGTLPEMACSPEVESLLYLSVMQRSPWLPECPLGDEPNSLHHMCGAPFLAPMPAAPRHSTFYSCTVS